MVMMSPSMATPFRWRTKPERLARRPLPNHPLGRVQYTPKGVNVRPVTAATTMTRPVSVALVDDYDVVVMGVANMLDQYADQVVVAELDTNRDVSDVVDIVLYDSFAQPESDHDEIAVLVGNPRARRVVVYTWNFAPDLVDSALK